MYDLGTPVTSLPGIGRTTAASLKRLGIATIGGLLYHLPTGYEDFGNRQKIAGAPTGIPATFKGVFISLQNRRSWRQRRLAITEGIFQDDTGALKVIWFGQPYLALAIPKNTPLFLAGTIERHQGEQQLVNPVWERASDESVHTGRLVPVYPLTRGLTHKQVRTFVAAALKSATIDDWFRELFLQSHRLLSLRGALESIHFPDTASVAEAARRRLAFDELFFLQLTRELSRQHRQRRRAPQLAASLDELAPRLPLTLTLDQRQAAVEILADLARPYPMHRLLQGEVGSGKTLVAALAAAATVRHGYQVLYLAPTEVLVSQQCERLREFLAPFGADVVPLTAGSGGAFAKRAHLQAIETGTASVVIGTHALLQASVRFRNLGLVIVDEQHRFGVEQRLTAQRKGVAGKGGGDGLVPHLLSMTATPIPRTLQLVFMGDLDISTLKTIPHGQRQVKTYLFGPADRRRVELAIHRRLARGEQVFVVCPLIDPSDKLGVRSATVEYERLRQEAFPDVPIGLLHGKLTARAKDDVLNDFREGRLKMLVATTVIEVGIDVPEASVILIEGAERFGLAQLHQLRGRVGRRGGEGVCVLFTESPSEPARQRLELFARTVDAWQLAELDLKLRGPGEWFGTTQSGFEEFRVADLNDAALLAEAKEAATEMIKSDPNLASHDLISSRVDGFLQKERHLS